jgi:hypothetical protein
VGRKPFQEVSGGHPPKPLTKTAYFAERTNQMESARFCAHAAGGFGTGAKGQALAAAD